jgi:hypothetical protein
LDERPPAAAKVTELPANVKFVIRRPGPYRSCSLLTSDQLQALEEKVDYVVEATKRLGRLDWRHVYITVMAEEIFRLALGSGRVPRLVGLTLRGLGQIFGGPEILGLP